MNLFKMFAKSKPVDNREKLATTSDDTRFQGLTCLGKYFILELDLDATENQFKINSVKGSIDALGYFKSDIDYSFYLRKIMMPYRPFVTAYDEVLQELLFNQKQGDLLRKHTMVINYPIVDAKSIPYVVWQKDFFHLHQGQPRIIRLCLILRKHSPIDVLTVEPFCDVNSKRIQRLVLEMKKRMGAKVFTRIPVHDEIVWNILELSANGLKRKDIRKALKLKSTNILDEHKKRFMKDLNQYFEVKFENLKIVARFLRAHSVI